jgi:hypothetical protein
MDGSVSTAECEKWNNCKELHHLIVSNMTRMLRFKIVKSRLAGWGRKINKGRKNNRLQGKKVRKLFCRVQKESRKEPLCKHGRTFNLEHFFRPWVEE